MASRKPETVIPGETPSDDVERTADGGNASPDADMGEPTLADEAGGDVQEQIDMLADRLIRLEKTVSRLTNAVAAAPIAKPEPQRPTQEEALAEAKKTGRAVMSRDGMVVAPVS